MTEIEKMLLLVQTYGLSHVCAKNEFVRNFEDLNDGSTETWITNLTFPYLDIYLQIDKNKGTNGWETSLQWRNIEVYFRGAKNQQLKFRNLFEYLQWASLHGIRLSNFIIFDFPNFCM